MTTPTSPSTPSSAAGHTAAQMIDPRDLTIERIEVVPVRVPLVKTFQGSHYSMNTRCTIVTRLYTSGGIVAEVYNGDTDAEQSVIVGILENEIVPHLIGQSALDVERCWQLMLPPTYDILRDRSLSLQAMACADTAIWDVIGQAVGLPMSKFWGGYRDRLPSICIGGYYTDNEADIAAQINEYRKLGFAGCKFKVGRLSPEADAYRTQLAREAGGDDFVLMVDANQGFTRREAIKFAALTEHLDIRWFEEPCQWLNDHLSMRDVRLTTGLPVAAGQSEATRAGLRNLIAAGAIDACNCDASWIGGPSEWRRIAAIASAYEVEMAHHEEPQISAHLLASIPHGTYLEAFGPDRDPVFWTMFANRQEFVDGDYLVPTGAGFGLELDHDFIDRYDARKA